MKKTLLEVAIASVEDALTAEHGGADRLELNSALALGGLTPSLGTLLTIKQSVRIPVMVMIRPRPGGFAYSSIELDVMKRDIELMVEHGADGIVFGVLMNDGMIDVARCQELMNLSGDTQVIFHRAFDVTPDPFQALEQLIDLGVHRVMTSGQEENAYYGAGLIRELIERARGRIEILPAGGVNRFTLEDILARTGCDQVHASLRGQQSDDSVRARPHISFGGAVKLPENRYDATREEAVVELSSLLNPND